MSPPEIDILAKFLDHVLIFVSYPTGYIEHIVYYRQPVFDLHLDDECQNVFEDSHQLSEFCVGQLDLCLQISFELTEKVIRQVHIF